MDPAMASWQRAADEARKLFEERREEALFGNGWLRRAMTEGVIAAAVTGSVSALLVAATLALI